MAGSAPAIPVAPPVPPPPQRLKIGIIGFGKFGQFLAKTFTKYHDVFAANKGDEVRACLLVLYAARHVVLNPLLMCRSSHATACTC